MSWDPVGHGLSSGLPMHPAGMWPQDKSRGFGGTWGSPHGATAPIIWWR